MEDYKYWAIATGTPFWDESNIKTEHLKRWCSIFKWNMLRTANLGIMPAMMAYIARKEQLILSNVMFEKLGRGKFTLHDVYNPEKRALVKDDAQSQWDAFDDDGLSLDDHVKGPFGVGFVEHLIGQNLGMRDGMDAIMAAIVSESYTAFECFLSDVWVSALNHGPQDIANKVAIHKDLKKKDDPITVKMLYESPYDVRKEIGSFLRETRRVSFQTLGDIKVAYSMAFGPEAIALFSKIDGGFIEALCACRNVLAHKAGRADSDFLSKVERFPEFSKCKLHETVFLDGELVSKMRNSAVVLALAVVSHVDKILTPRAV